MAPRTRQLHHVASGAACLAVAVGCGAVTRPGPPSLRPATSQLPDCPRSPGGYRAKGVGLAIGSGPAYVVLGLPESPPSPLGVVDLHGDVRSRGLHLHETLWAISPSARSALVVRATSLTHSERIGFYDGQSTHSKLTMPEPSGRWQYGVTSTALPGPGCYAFHVTGRHIDQRIVFEAVDR